MKSLEMNKKRKLTMLCALSYAIAWNEGLIDAHTILGEVDKSNKQFVRECEKEIKAFSELHRELSHRDPVRCR